MPPNDFSKKEMNPLWAKKSLHLKNPSQSWALIMQSGVTLKKKVGIPLATFMSEELLLTDEQINLAETLLLDGMPVDDPASAIVNNGSRLALAAGLPGIAGLAMKKNSGVKALRGSITHTSCEPLCPRMGQVTLALYSLVMPLLAPHFLKEGVWVRLRQLQRYGNFAPLDLCQTYVGPMTVVDFLNHELKSKTIDEFFLTADFELQ
ncbi:MAG: hypothetical protein ACRCTY_09225 [Candidatus Adiutrix sp.]